MCAGWKVDGWNALLRCDFLLSAFASLPGLCSFCCILSALVCLLRVIMIIIATHHSVTRASDYCFLETPFT